MTEKYTLDDDFNLDEDYKPVPLIPAQKGLKGDIVKAEADMDKACLNLSVLLYGNANAMCDDQETPVDGQQLVAKVWWPTKEDRDKQTASGKQSKWQWKVNNMKEVFQSLGVQASTPQQIKDAIEDSSFLVTGVKVDVDVTFLDDGRPLNQVQKIYR